VQIRAAYSSMVGDPKRIEPFIEAITRSDRQTIGDSIYELITTDLRDKMKHIKVPVLLVLATAGSSSATRRSPPTSPITRSW